MTQHNERLNADQMRNASDILDRRGGGRTSSLSAVDLRKIIFHVAVAHDDELDLEPATRLRELKSIFDDNAVQNPEHFDAVFTPDGFGADERVLAAKHIQAVLRGRAKVEDIHADTMAKLQTEPKKGGKKNK